MKIENLSVCSFADALFLYLKNIAYKNVIVFNYNIEVSVPVNHANTLNRLYLLSEKRQKEISKNQSVI